MFFTCEVAKCVKVIVARLSLQSRLEMNLHNLLAFLVPKMFQGHNESPRMILGP